MDFENLFSKPPNPALGKKTAPASEERINDETEDTEVEETHEEKVKLEYKQIRPKSKHFGNSVIPQKRSPRQKSRSKDYDAYSDDSEACSQASEDNFAEELKRYIKAKEMANATQPSLLPGESVTKEMAKGTQQTVKQKNKKFKAGHKNGKQKKTKKAKRKRAGARNKESSPLLRKSGSQEEDGQPKEKQQCVKLSQGFINQHTVERKGKQICKYFLERKCIKGDQCKFHHDAELEKKQEMCKFYVQGYCNRGEHCLYLHNEYPCKFYHTGTKCYQGEHCRFSHAPLTPETQKLLARVLDTEKQS